MTRRTRENKKDWPALFCIHACKPRAVFGKKKAEEETVLKSGLVASASDGCYLYQDRNRAPDKNQINRLKTDRKDLEYRKNPMENNTKFTST